MVGWTAQIPGAAALRERAEAAVIQTDVRVVDVPINDIRDRIADRFVTQLVRCGDNLLEIATFDGKEAHDVRLNQPLPGTRRPDNGTDPRRVAAALQPRTFGLGI